MKTDKKQNRKRLEREADGEGKGRETEKEESGLEVRNKEGRTKKN